MATGITVTMLCPGPTFSNLLAGAATEKSGEVSYLDSWLCHKVGTLVKFQVTQPIQMKPISKYVTFSMAMQIWADIPGAPIALHQLLLNRASK